MAKKISSTPSIEGFQPSVKSNSPGHFGFQPIGDPCSGAKGGHQPISQGDQGPGTPPSQTSSGKK